MAYYNIRDWYWALATDPMNVWSSARVGYFPLTDEAFNQWLTLQGRTNPPTIDSPQSLLDVLMTQWIPMASSSGVEVVCDTDAALNGIYGVDATSILNITSLATGITAGKPLPSGDSSFIYRDVFGGPHTFSGPEFVAFGSAIETYVYQFREYLMGLVLKESPQPDPPASQPIHFSGP